ncbi:hypothetical protein B0H16DRAFT_802406 [Mycena metata]|uniref:Uncharacterized protein n=1 Tax=Mycena metata TaxID=1033252 RepID=A0AAD7K684_9AGAR|nr:hypothetical protein B0H16DRAFT_802406 [Mycena metata]
MEIDEDVFSCILSHIPDAKTLHMVLTALPTSHFLFPATLTRLWQLPVHLDSYDPQVAAASQEILDHILQDNVGHSLVESLRHLVVAIEHKPRANWKRRKARLAPPTLAPPPEVVALHARLPDLLRRAMNLESLDYHSFISGFPFPGLGLESEHVQSLLNLERFEHFAVDCALRFVSDGQIPSAMGPGDWSAEYDAENWESESFLSSVGHKIKSLDLRHVNQTMFTALTHQTDVFASYHNLEDLRLDITDGVWDWDGGGSPAMGPGPGFTFPFLGFPSLKQFELIVCDKTLTGSTRGPLNLVHCNVLTSLTIDVRHSLDWMTYETINLFVGLSPLDFPALSFLEVKDHTRNTARHHWEADPSQHSRVGRAYPGFVSSFTGALPSLTSLWVDERVLLQVPLSISLQSLLTPVSFSSADEPTPPFSWTQGVRATLARLDSLRVGFGAIDHIDAKLILNLCSPQRLTQFGFEWKWSAYGRDEVISTELLAQLARFPKLVDVHILFPRPETHHSRMPPPITLNDVASIFRCNGSISRVGIANSVVWERHPSDPSGILLVSDGSIAFSPAVPQFYHAGFLARHHSRDISNNAVGPRPDRGDEIEQLRDLLQRIVM